MIENTVKIWRLNVRKRAAHVRGSAPLSLLLAMWTWGKLTYGLKNMINLLLLYCRADQCESDGNYRNSVNTLVYSYLLLWQHLPRWEWYLCRMLGPLPVCTWLDGVLSKNGMILSRRDGFASYFTKAQPRWSEHVLRGNWHRKCKAIKNIDLSSEIDSGEVNKLRGNWVKLKKRCHLSVSRALDSWAALPLLKIIP